MDQEELKSTGSFTKLSLLKYKALFDSNMIGVASTNWDDTVYEANDAFLNIIGYTQEDIASGKLRWSLISPVKYDEIELGENGKIAELVKKGVILPFEKEYIHKKGHLVPVLVGGESISVTPPFGVCFAVDISELKQLEQKKDDFIGMVSHELRTPLSIMKLQSDFLKTAIEDNEDKEELLELTNEIGNQLDKLNVLITDLLNMARYQADETAFAINTVELVQIVSKAVSDISLLEKIKINFQATDTIYVNANPGRFSQVVINLITNAIRYSSADSEITVRVYAKDDTAHVEVEDHGMGISKENTEKIFERYYRINHADDYAQKGAGIGLYICREIIKQHHGTISVKSVQGKGSTFIIKLPLIK